MAANIVVRGLPVGERCVDNRRMAVKRVSVIASASGNGKTTVGRLLASRLNVPFVELDELVHGPGWVETPDDELRAQLEPILASEAWVIDGSYEHKIGDLIVRAADLVVWLDLPIRVWLPRLIRRTWRVLRSGDELWNGNRQSVRDAVWGRDSLVGWALQTHVRSRRNWPDRLAGLPVVRLRTPADVERFLQLPVASFEDGEHREHE
jgi:adenylate kinase family enzyme